MTIYVGAAAGVLLKDRAEAPSHEVTFRETGLLRGHTETVAALALGTFNDDSIVVSGGGRDRTLKVWNHSTRQNIMTFRYQDWVGSVSQDSTIGRWDLVEKASLTAPVTAGQQELLVRRGGRDVVASCGQNSLTKL